MAAVLLWGGPLRAQEEAGAWVERLADADTRDQARDKLRDLGAEAVPALLQALHHKDPVIRSESAFVLGRIGRKQAVPSLIEALKDPDVRVRTNGAYALGELGDVRAVEPLLKALSDADAPVRANACFALGLIGDPKAARELVKALGDADENVRNFAAKALGSTKDRRALAALEWVAVNDRSSDVRALATSSLGGLADPRICPVLVRLLEDKEDIVRARAIESLLAITHERRGYEYRDAEPKRAAAVARWKTWLKNQRLAALDPQPPQHVYDWWFGKPEPKPEPRPEPKPEPLVEPPAQTEPDLLGPPVPLKISPVTTSSLRATDAKLPSPEALAFFNAGRKRFEAGEFAAAAQAFESCAGLAPASKEALFNLALCRSRPGRLDEASAAYRACLALDPRDAECANSLGTLCETQGPAEAEALYRQALKAAPDFAPARFNLAELLFRTGRIAEPRRLFEALAGESPRGIDASVVKLRLGTCLRRYGEAAKAAAALDEAVGGATDPGVLREAARQFAAIKRYDRAKALLERAYEISGGEAESAYLLALLLLRAPDEKLRDIEKAAVYAEVAYTSKPSDERFVSAMAEAAWGRGEKAKAAGLIEEALRTNDSEALRKQLEEYRKAPAP